MCLVSHAFGLDPNRPLFQYVRENWNTEAKFPGGAVNAIARTHDGYLWIGTDRGLFRFDGFNFVRIAFPSTAGASDVLRQKGGEFETVAYGAAPLNSHVTAVSKDKNGAVLISDIVAGTFRFEGENTQRVATPTTLPGSSPVILMAETSEGRIWLGTLGAGLFLLADSHAAPANAAFPERKINCLLPISKQNLLVGTDNGLYRWHDQEYRREALPSSLGNLQILSLLQDRDSNVWVGTDRGLVRITRHRSHRNAL